ATGQDPAEDPQERQAGFTAHRGGCLRAHQQQAQQGEQQGGGAQAPGAQLIIERHAQRRTDGNGAIHRHAVPGQYPGGAVRAGPGDGPARRAGAVEALGDAQQHPTYQQQRQSGGGVVLQRSDQGQQAAQGAGQQAADHRQLAAQPVAQAAGQRAAQQGGQV